MTSGPRAPRPVSRAVRVGPEPAGATARSARLVLGPRRRTRCDGHIGGRDGQDRRGFLAENRDPSGSSKTSSPSRTRPLQVLQCLPVLDALSCCWHGPCNTDRAWQTFSRVGYPTNHQTSKRRCMVRQSRSKGERDSRCGGCTTCYRLTRVTQQMRTAKPKSRNRILL